MPVRAPFLRTALLAAALLTACGTAPEPAAAPSAAPSGEAAGESAGKPSAEPSREPAVKAAGPLGGPGTACALPVSFSLAEGWEAAAIEKPKDPALASLVTQGPATVLCEAKSEGTPDIAFLRVWTAPKGSARSVLKAFAEADESKGIVLTDLKAGAVPAVEARYSVYSKLTEEWRRTRSFAVRTDGGAVVVVGLAGLDSGEEAVTAAYELAKSTLRLS
ncbi:lipoprotein [Streptomyces filamentosus]|uniref:lipoprotein n=1 Tax=Streptomyces filamentosus TaxID=67294 RepID=UPI0033FB398B